MAIRTPIPRSNTGEPTTSDRSEIGLKVKPMGASVRRITAPIGALAPKTRIVFMIHLRLVNRTSYAPGYRWQTASLGGWDSRPSLIAGFGPVAGAQR